MSHQRLEPDPRASQPDPWGIVLIEWAARLLSIVFCVCFGSVIGFGLLGGWVAMAGHLLGQTWLSNSAPPVAWLLGAAAGLAVGLSRLSKPFFSRRTRPGQNAEEDVFGDDESGDGESDPDEYAGNKIRWKRPGLGELAKTTALFGLIGAGGGMLLSLYLGIVLISVTTSPFASPRWRAASVPVEEPALAEDAARPHRRSRDGLQSSVGFQHPLLGTILAGSISTMTGLGLVAGVVFACIEDEARRDDA